MDNDLAKRIDRLEAVEAIKQLPARYSLALDSRNLDDWVGLFIEDVRVGRDTYGRAALREWAADTLSKYTTSMHLTGNHVIDFDDDDHAHGIVYCFDQHESGEHWMNGTLQYWDTYERRDGRWYFARRKVMQWCSADMLERPTGPNKVRRPGQPPEQAHLPGAWPTWSEFWASRGNSNPPMG